MNRHDVRRWAADEIPRLARHTWVTIGRPDFRDIVIIAGLAMAWVGLRDIYPPAAPLAVGAFLVWFAAIRRVES